ncbi:MAG: CDP-glycerol glycerophosphotransferase family protein [Kiritimatiellia bacterium]
MSGKWTDRLRELSSVALRRVVAQVFRFVPRDDRLIVFCNFNGAGFGDNLAPIANELMRRRVDCRMAWLVNDLGLELPAAIRKVKRGWIREAIALSRAKIVISNTKGSLHYCKKRNSFYLQTWHGGDLPTKLCEACCEQSLSWHYVYFSKLDSAMTDYVLSGSDRLSEVFRNEFWYPKSCRILEFGTPRKDLYFTSSPEKIRSVKRQLFGRSEVRVALYAPTFREKTSNAECMFDGGRLHRLLVRKFGGEWLVVVRLHPNVARSASLFAYDENVVNGTQIPDGQLLNLVADFLITDYSSIIEDFVVQGKPVFLFVRDRERYEREERRLQEFWFRLPFDRCETEDALFNAIEGFDREEYSGRVARFLAANCRLFDDGHASERVVDLIERLMETH